jgi:Bacteriocin-protection, YdeI or OmpD-Associated/Domain of unknown function (DUF1905)
MSEKHTFTAVIKNAGGGGAFVEIPFDVEAAFGSKRPKVQAMIEGHPYRGTLVRMGTDCHIFPVLKEIREQVGKDFGDEVEITLEADLEPRIIAVPPDLAELFEQAPEVRTFFEKLAYTHQKEYVNWINDAKQETTRQKRVAKTIEMLKAGKKGK